MEAWSSPHQSMEGLLVAFEPRSDLIYVAHQLHPQHVPPCPFAEMLASDYTAPHFEEGSGFRCQI